MRSSHLFTSRTGTCSVTNRKSMTTCRRSLTRCWCKSRSRRLSRARSHNIYCHVQGVYSRASWREPAASILRNRRGGHGGQLAMSVPPTTLGAPHSNMLALPEPRRAAIRLCSNQRRQQSCCHPSTPPAGCSRWTTWRIRWQPATATPESTSEWAIVARTARTCTRTCGSCCSLIRFYPASEYLGTSFGFRRLPFRRSQRAAGGGAGSGFNRHRYDDDDLCIPYSPGTLGSWSPYRNGRPPDSCFECGAAQGHFAHECPKRFVRVRGRAPLGWLQDGSKDPAQWDGTELTAAARADYRRFPSEHPVPSHHVFYISLEEIVGSQPPPLRRAPVAGRR